MLVGIMWNMVSFCNVLNYRHSKWVIKLPVYWSACRAEVAVCFRCCLDSVWRLTFQDTNEANNTKFCCHDTPNRLLHFTPSSCSPPDVWMSFANCKPSRSTKPCIKMRLCNDHLVLRRNSKGICCCCYCRHQMHPQII